MLPYGGLVRTERLGGRLASIGLGLVALFLASIDAHAKTVRYELTATRVSVNLSGARTVDFALALNGTIPAPTLEFTEGDTAEILVRNRIPGEELSIHWHGLLVPVEMDGVPYLTTPTIHSGSELLFTFPIRQNGTYWYHSHTNVQEQKGLFGAIVIHPKVETIKVDREITLVVSDWSDEDALSILRHLRVDGDYYLRKKHSLRTWFGALQAGRLGSLLSNEWQRMGGMDLSDVGYDAFLINGKRGAEFPEVSARERVRVRVINASASTYFFVQAGGEPLHVISADGIDVQPVRGLELLLAMAETYDFILEPSHHPLRRELRFTAQDQTGSVSAWFGTGPTTSAPDRAPIDLYAPMDHSSHGSHGGSHTGGPAPTHQGHQAQETMPADPHAGHSMHSGHAMNAGTALDLLGVEQLRSLAPTEFPAATPRQELTLVLGGDMERYVWNINGKPIHEDRTITIREGDVIRFVFKNETMMHHPMHLHGHFFRVINNQGTFSPLKHTVDVPPFGTRTIEFLANEPGEWMLHCHNLYHLKNGMARVIRYLSYTPKPELAHHQAHDPHAHDHWYSTASLDLGTNLASARARMFQTRNELELRTELRNSGSGFSRFDARWDLDADLWYRRWVDTYFSWIAGGVWFDEKPALAIGAELKLPLLFHSQAAITHDGRPRFSLEKRFQWTDVLHTDAEIKWMPRLLGSVEASAHPLEGTLTLLFAPSWHWGVGLILTESSLGAGGTVRF